MQPHRYCVQRPSVEYENIMNPLIQCKYELNLTFQRMKRQKKVSTETKWFS